MIPENIQYRLKKNLDSKGKVGLSSASRIQLIKRWVGYCRRCSAIATKLVSYDIDGAEILSRYCDDCFTETEKYI